MISGRVAPNTATGIVRLRVAGRRLEKRLRGGAFKVTLKLPHRARRVVIAYRGDAGHAPATRKVTAR